jgi:hypothetical protein
MINNPRFSLVPWTRRPAKVGMIQLCDTFPPSYFCDERVHGWPDEKRHRPSGRTHRFPHFALADSYIRSFFARCTSPAAPLPRRQPCTAATVAIGTLGMCTLRASLQRTAASTPQTTRRQARRVEARLDALQSLRTAHVRSPDIIDPKAPVPRGETTEVIRGQLGPAAHTFPALTLGYCAVP